MELRPSRQRGCALVGAHDVHIVDCTAQRHSDGSSHMERVCLPYVTNPPREWYDLPGSTRRKPFVFCIGLGKTGTSSFAAAMRRLRYPHATGGHLPSSRAFGRTTATAFERFLSFDDNPWPLAYQSLDRVFPNARFVLTRRRTPDVWLVSLQKHYCVTGPTAAKRYLYGYNSPYCNPKHHIDLYNSHLTAVRSHFDEQPERFIELCWEAGDGWSQLTQFLCLPSRNGKFPFANRRTLEPGELAALKAIADCRTAILEGHAEFDYQQVVADIEKLSKAASTQFALGQLAYDLKKYEPAVAFVNRAIAARPNSKRYQKFLARIKSREQERRS